MSWNLHCYCLLVFCLTLTALVELGFSSATAREPGASRHSAMAVGAPGAFVPLEWPR